MELRGKLEERAATIWECDRDAVSYGDDAVLRGPDGNAMTLTELAGQLQATGGLIQARADVSPTTAGPAFATHVVDVEVDPETGKVDILRYTAAQDVGTAIHPDYVEGQIQGGAAQGVGMAVTEEYLFNDDGGMVNSTLLDYRMPTAPRPADDRGDSGRGAEPWPPLRRAWRGRSGHHPADGGGDERESAMPLACAPRRSRPRRRASSRCWRTRPSNRLTATNGNMLPGPLPREGKRARSCLEAASRSRRLLAAYLSSQASWTWAAISVNE